MMQQTGKYILIAAGVLALIGIVFMLLGNRLNFLGRLPGDIRIEKENFRFYFPITTMLLITAIINIVILVIKSFF